MFEWFEVRSLVLLKIQVFLECYAMSTGKWVPT